jgi:hypothetical protein
LLLRLDRRLTPAQVDVVAGLSVMQVQAGWG